MLPGSGTDDFFSAVEVALDPEFGCPMFLLLMLALLLLLILLLLGDVTMLV